MKNDRFLILSVCACAACGPNTAANPTGNATIYLEAEDTITGGLTAGTTEDTVIDGWSIAYTQFVGTIGDVHMSRTATGATQINNDVHTVNLRSLPTSGFTLAAFTNIDAAVWDVIGFTTPIVTASAIRDASVPTADFMEMTTSGCTYLIAGTLTNPSGQSCQHAACTVEHQVDFRLCVPAATTFGPCQTPDGMIGFAVAAGATTNANITIHGDHMWFNSFPSGAESMVERRGQWIVDCDADHDGHVTQAELMATQAAAVFTTTNHYDLGGAPLVDGHGVMTAWDFVRAQLTTIGHFQGEGDCPWAVGVAGGV